MTPAALAKLKNEEENGKKYDDLMRRASDPRLTTDYQQELRRKVVQNDIDYNREMTLREKGGFANTDFSAITPRECHETKYTYPTITRQR